jgi:hypothetical protein
VAVATLLDPAKRAVDVGQSRACGCEEPDMDLIACGIGVRLCWGGVELVKLADAERSLTLEETFRCTDELRGQLFGR